MKLSEAIRKGCASTEQCFQSFSTGNGTCAIGSAWSAVGGSFGCGATLVEGMANAFPILMTEVSDPGGKYDPAPMFSMIFRLNDAYKWTREAIAMWVETIEKEREMETTSGVKTEEFLTCAE